MLKNDPVFLFSLRKKKTNYFIVSLAFADLLVALVVMPFAAIELTTGQWFFGEIFCLVRTSLDVLLTTASILHLCCIALDRSVSVIRTLRGRVENVCCFFSIKMWRADWLLYEDFSTKFIAALFCYVNYLPFLSFNGSCVLHSDCMLSCVFLWKASLMVVILPLTFCTVLLLSHWT